MYSFYIASNKQKIYVIAPQNQFCLHTLRNKSDIRYYLSTPIVQDRDSSPNKHFVILPPSAAVHCTSQKVNDDVLQLKEVLVVDSTKKRTKVRIQ